VATKADIEAILAKIHEQLLAQMQAGSRVKLV
jgi:hypothetical protein